MEIQQQGWMRTTTQHAGFSLMTLNVSGLIFLLTSVCLNKCHLSRSRLSNRAPGFANGNHSTGDQGCTRHCPALLYIMVLHCTYWTGKLLLNQLISGWELHEPSIYCMFLILTGDYSSFKRNYSNPDQAIKGLYTANVVKLKCFQEQGMSSCEKKLKWVLLLSVFTL